jgi:hypothetical protein
MTLGATVSTVGVISGLGAWSRLLGLRHPRLAARLQGGYEALSQTYGIQMSPRLRDVTDIILAQAGPPSELDPVERARLVEEGRRLTYDDLLRIARDLSEEESAAWDVAQWEAPPLASAADGPEAADRRKV